MTSADDKAITDRLNTFARAYDRHEPDALNEARARLFAAIDAHVTATVSTALDEHHDAIEAWEWHSEATRSAQRFRQLSEASDNNANNARIYMAEQIAARIALGAVEGEHLVDAAHRVRAAALPPVAASSAQPAARVEVEQAIARAVNSAHDMRAAVDALVDAARRGALR